MISRNQRATSFIELTIGIAVIVPVLLVLLDFAIILIGVEANDDNCRRAARAAAAGSPEAAQLRAETIIASNSHGHSMLAASQLTSPVAVRVVSRPEPEQDLATGKEIFTGGPVIGSTTVTTQIEVKPVLVHMFYGGKTPLVFKSTHAFPISYVMPAR